MQKNTLKDFLTVSYSLMLTMSSLTHLHLYIYRPTTDISAADSRNEGSEAHSKASKYVVRLHTLLIM